MAVFCFGDPDLLLILSEIAIMSIHGHSLACRTQMREPYRLKTHMTFVSTASRDL